MKARSPRQVTDRNSEQGHSGREAFNQSLPAGVQLGPPSPSGKLGPSIVRHWHISLVDFLVHRKWHFSVPKKVMVISVSQSAC